MKLGTTSSRSLRKAGLCAYFRLQFMPVIRETSVWTSSPGALFSPKTGLGCLAGGGGCVYLCASYLYRTKNVTEFVSGTVPEPESEQILSPCGQNRERNGSKAERKSSMLGKGNETRIVIQRGVSSGPTVGPRLDLKSEPKPELR
ncbi:hypothetical protein EVAR_4694_1 [Eumeta japonica]|uniref:Uncharacterized protein n=1 Tax=Eumeta variegata TaxID=151549 RepID=A0A4C1WM97_EUMVA|nr:hypothetical protein EVAR_4694_1 [Eumeta japonica]